MVWAVVDKGLVNGKSPKSASSWDEWYVTAKVVGSWSPKIVVVCWSKSKLASRFPVEVASHKVRSSGAIASAWLVTIKLKTGSLVAT